MAQPPKHDDHSHVNQLNCPVCDVPMLLLRVGTHSDGGPMNYYECKKCGAQAEVPPLV